MLAIQQALLDASSSVIWYLTGASTRLAFRQTHDAVMLLRICRLGSQLAWTGDEDESHVLSYHFCIGCLDLQSQHLFLFEWN